MILQKLRIFCLAILVQLSTAQHNIYFCASQPQTHMHFICCIRKAGFLRNLFFLPGIVLFTFLHFNETPAIVTSVVIGLGIVFCGGAVIHNVFVWQRVSIYLILLRFGITISWEF